jgi:Probable cobalt transporter subunit (CbtB)
MSQLTARLHGTRTPAAALMALLGATSLLFAVAFDQGQVAALAQAAFGDSTVHELFHDARHMLGFPCH